MTIRLLPRLGDEAGLERLFEELYDPALLIDPDSGEIIGANRAALTFLDYSADELAGLSPADLHPHELSRFQSFIGEVVSRGRWSSDELSCRAKGGRLKPAEIRASSVHIGGRQCILILIHDRRADELARLGQSVRQLAHDLNNTLATALLLTDRLAAAKDPEIKRIAENVARSIDRAVAMCRRTLKVGSAAEPTPRRERFLLKDVVTEVASALGPGTGETSPIVLDDSAATASAELDADFDQVFRILLNLAVNAQAAGARTIRIAGEADATTALVDLADDGPGLPEDVRRLLYAEKPELSSGGSGLLASGPSGTRFRVTLPKPGA